MADKSNFMVLGKDFGSYEEWDHYGDWGHQYNNVELTEFGKYVLKIENDSLYTLIFDSDDGIFIYHITAEDADGVEVKPDWSVFND